MTRAAADGRYVAVYLQGESCSLTKNIVQPAAPDRDLGDRPGGRGLPVISHFQRNPGMDVHPRRINIRGLGKMHVKLLG